MKLLLKVKSSETLFSKNGLITINGKENMLHYDETYRLFHQTVVPEYRKNSKYWDINLIRIYTGCHSIYIFWRHYCIVKSNCFILRTTTAVSLGVPIFRVFTVLVCLERSAAIFEDPGT